MTTYQAETLFKQNDSCVPQPHSRGENPKGKRVQNTSVNMIQTYAGYYYR